MASHLEGGALWKFMLYNMIIWGLSFKVSLVYLILINILFDLLLLVIRLYYFVINSIIFL
jgi:hypothetical protein